jgi:hypothetical protein
MLTKLHSLNGLRSGNSHGQSYSYKTVIGLRHIKEDKFNLPQLMYAPQ